MGWTVGEEVKGSDRVQEGCRRIARETSELTYSWDRERCGKKEIDSDRNIVE